MEQSEIGRLRVVVQERRRVLRDGLLAVLTAEPDIVVVAAVASSDELASAYGRRAVDAVVLGGSDSASAGALRDRHPGLRIIVLCGEVDRIAIEHTATARGIELVGRDHGVAGLLAALRAAGGAAPLRLTDSAAAPRSPGPLTTRETDVLGLIGAGRTTTEISTTLGISPKTVENHKQRMFTKLGVQSQAHAVAVAMRNRLLSTPAAVLVARPQIVSGRIA